jgi:hypothetical protein
VDADKREITLRPSNGKEFTVEVPESVKGLSEVKAGDQVNIDYYQSLAIALKRPEAGAVPSARETVIERAAGGGLPGGLVSRRITSDAEVLSVDATNNDLSVRTSSGKVDTIKVKDPGAQATLRQLKAGDRIQLTYTEGLAITINRPSK